MRKTLILLLISIFTVNAWAQTQIDNSPIYYKNGMVGIGKTDPISALHINGFPFVNSGYPLTDPYAWGIDETGEVTPNTRRAFVIQKHNGLSFSAHSYYGGIRFYNQQDGPTYGYNGTMVMSITDGNVGIGTIAPQSLLQVSTFTNSSYMTLGSNAGVAFSVVKGDEGYGLFTGISGNGDVWLQAGRTNTATAYNLLLQASGGNVGIGTTTPRSRLDLGGRVGANNGLRIGDYLEINEREDINNSSVIGFNAYIDPGDISKFKPVYSGAEYSSGMVLSMEGGGVGNLDFYGYNWGTNGTSRSLSEFNHVMRLNANGNVGIGTTNPLYKLSVKGTIGCGEIKVENVTGWADFVFEPDYDLMPLNELGTYIQQNKHLPEIPTTADVKENGISVGEMNAKLLQKIEELTLYMLNQQQEIDELKAEVKELKK